MINFILGFFTKENLVKILTFIKQYWYIFVFAGIVIYFQVKVRNLEQTIINFDKIHQEQLTAYNLIYDQERSLRETLDLDYQNKLTILSEQYIQQNKQLINLRKSKIVVISKEFGEDPQKLKTEIEKKYGFKFIEH